MKIIIMGVSGSGKSAVAGELCKLLKYDFIEGDELHSEKNIKKMSAGVPLSDEDRIPWLEKINSVLIASSGNLILTCSALKKRYRDIILRNVKNSLLVYLDVDEIIAANRIEERKGHFFNSSLLSSQFDILELPEEAFWIDASLDVGVITKKIAEIVKKKQGF
ncbi:MAG: gluconokinase [Deltaproteobacteria bacterium]|nr:gluconokinase [Deltaproteobacteria bacterium]